MEVVSTINNLYLNSATVGHHFHNFENSTTKSKYTILKNNPLLSDFNNQNTNVLNNTFYNMEEAEIKTELNNDFDDVKKWRQQQQQQEKNNDEITILNHHNTKNTVFNLDFELLDSWNAVVGFGPPPPLINLHQHHEDLDHSPDALSKRERPVCPICGHEAGKHSHYGGKGCASCRAFFRRSVQNKSYQNFACAKNKNCAIDSKSWKSCRYCRFQRCLDSGMKPSWVMNDEERKIRHEKRTGKKPIDGPSTCDLKTTGSGSSRTFVMVDMVQSTNPDILTVDELMFFSHQHLQWKNYMLDSLAKFYAYHPNNFKAVGKETIHLLEIFRFVLNTSCFWNISCFFL